MSEHVPNRFLSPVACENTIPIPIPILKYSTLNKALFLPL